MTYSEDVEVAVRKQKRCEPHTSHRFDGGIAALADPKNEPLRWLLEDTLRQHAATAVGSHFLLEALADPIRKPSLAAWNARLHQFRDLLRNPDDARTKAAAELQCGPQDAEAKLMNFVAEAMAVVHLHSMGYMDFEVVQPSRQARRQPSPDFTASFQGQRAAIEVKNLQEPDDILRTVAVSHWKKLAEADPERYGFRVFLRHRRCGKLTEPAQQRLRNILEQLPETKTSPYRVTLDGGIDITIERPNLGPPSPGEQAALANLTSGKKSQLVIVTSFHVGDLSTSINELQALFLKSMRVIVEATPKFYSTSYNPGHRNVIALHWNPPEPMFDPEMLTHTSERIEKLFRAFTLQLTPVIFCAPDLPWALIRQYT